MNRLVHLPERAGMLGPGQFKVTEFVFDVFEKNPSWDGRTDVVISLLRAAVFPQPSDPDVSRYTPFIESTTQLHGLCKINGAYDAVSATFPSVGGKERSLIVGVLIHSNGLPIAHIGHAAGLPLWTNGCDITITWDRGHNKIFRI